MGSFATGLLEGLSSSGRRRKGMAKMPQMGSSRRGGSSKTQGLSATQQKGARRIEGLAKRGAKTVEKGIAKLVHSFDKGGKVRKTGLAKVHKGERVLTKKQAKRYRRRKGKR